MAILVLYSMSLRAKDVATNKLIISPPPYLVKSLNLIISGVLSNLGTNLDFRPDMQFSHHEISFSDKYKPGIGNISQAYQDQWLFSGSKIPSWLAKASSENDVV